MTDEEIEIRKIKYCDVCGISNKETKVFYSKQFNQTLCNKHNCQLRQYGKILDKTKKEINDYILYDDYAEIILYDKFNKEKARTIIDLEDVDKCKIYRWGLHHKHVTNIRDNKNSNSPILFLHNYIMNYIGKLDHEDRNPLNNRKYNLRPATYQENARNITKSKNKSSEYIGVVWSKHNNKWRARINIGNKNVIHLGYFEDINDAIKARLEAEKKYFGEFAPQKHLYEKYGISS